MADDHQTTSPSNSKADKERSRQQSRSVSGREAARTSGGGKNRSPGGGGKNRPPNGGGSKSNSGNAQRRAAQRSATATQSTKGRKRRHGGRAPTGDTRSRRALYTWGVVGLVVIIVLVVVLVDVTSGSGGGNNESVTRAAPASVVQGVSTIPASVYDKVGITSSITVTPPTVIKNQPPLTYTVDGKTLPGVLYYGAEFCPFCAAERWVIAAAMSRFGKFSGLEITKSSSTDQAGPNTPTLSFAKATFSSPYIAVKTVESANRAGQPLQRPTKAEAALVTKYDSSKYVKSLQSSGSSGGSIPFMTLGNKALVVGASYNPLVLAGQTQEQIAKSLDDPSNQVTQAIIAAANYQVAAVCAATGGKPGSVCSSSGTQTAAKALKLKI